MSSWTRRIRGALGMGVVWGVAFGLVGGIVARFPGMNGDLPLPLLFAPLGFATGVIFSGVMVAMTRRRNLAQLTMSRFAAWGATSGVLLSSLFVVGATLRGANVLSEFLLFGPGLIAAGTLSAAGSLALARRGSGAELGVGDDLRELAASK